MSAGNQTAQASARADTMPPGDADIILHANHRNLVKNVGAGRTLSGREVNLLQAIQNGGRAEARAFEKSKSRPIVDFLPVPAIHTLRNWEIGRTRPVRVALAVLQHLLRQ